ncbi:hypothetical protein MKZ38_000706 [Zalerion maritima]|uniref:Uncharacterized protein n=1 Tax=Zalerion maritima TaxID=339359 RepID=A0AAD5RSQ7_9PEZI|nr:hypothetical protein MKZ38_000706 [Zalerion maritima]
MDHPDVKYRAGITTLQHTPHQGREIQMSTRGVFRYLQSAVAEYPSAATTIFSTDSEGGTEPVCWVTCAFTISLRKRRLGFAGARVVLLESRLKDTARRVTATNRIGDAHKPSGMNSGSEVQSQTVQPSICCGDRY